MGRYVTQRLMLSGLSVLLVTLIVFTLLRVIVPAVYADAVDVVAADLSHSDPERAAELRAEYGLSGNLAMRYIEWVGGILRFDLGESIQNGRPVTKELRARLPVSVELGLIGLTGGLIISIPMGIVAAIWQDRWPDYIFRTIAIMLHCVPGFWMAIMIITFGSVWFNWAPPLHFAYIQDDPVAHFKIMLLPALLIGLTPSAGLMRIVRTQMLEVMRQDYVRTARSKGLTERAVIIRHAMRNALVPVVTVIGLSLPGLIAGTAIFESIFTLPGMGQYLVGSVSRMDYPVIQSTNLVFAVLIVSANLAVDLAYPFLDPRIRY
ncbi:MAG: ABC transporter permease, partial [Thermodesulfobacteriota bacterium]